ncbi:hypothetical protein CSKR_106061 [Clonorchis sinensis]|uniref:Uncharacterized protein n=1 Tax=Clonorchis sinensis TaxID=79923 RepID=A0A3R7CGE4_CLOSI|nr:hypothetical protein CSKR_106061 [Clonorchis sinensis]
MEVAVAQPKARFLSVSLRIRRHQPTRAMIPRRLSNTWRRLSPATRTGQVSHPCNKTAYTVVSFSDWCIDLICHTTLHYYTLLRFPSLKLANATRALQIHALTTSVTLKSELIQLPRYVKRSTTSSASP